MEIDIKKLMTAIIGAAVGLIMLASLLVPILDIATTTHEDLSNTGYYNMSYGDDVTLEWNRTAPNIIKVNNVDVDVSGLVRDKQLSIMCSDTFCARYMVTGSGTTITIQALGDFNGIQSGTSGSWVSMKITCSSGTMTAVQTKTDLTHNTRTTSYTDGVYYISSSGNYVMKDADKPAYMYDDSPIFALGVTEPSGLIYCLKGTIGGGVTVTDVNVPVGTIASAVTVNKTADPNYIDVYDLSTMTFTATLSDSTEIPITYSYYVVPAKITGAERTEHMTDTEIDLLNLAPTLLILAIAIGLLIPLLRNRE